MRCHGSHSPPSADEAGDAQRLSSECGADQWQFRAQTQARPAGFTRPASPTFQTAVDMGTTSAQRDSAGPNGLFGHSGQSVVSCLQASHGGHERGSCSLSGCSMHTWMVKFGCDQARTVWAVKAPTIWFLKEDLGGKPPL